MWFKRKHELPGSWSGVERVRLVSQSSDNPHSLQWEDNGPEQPESIKSQMGLSKLDIHFFQFISFGFILKGRIKRWSILFLSASESHRRVTVVQHL